VNKKLNTTKSIAAAILLYAAGLTAAAASTASIDDADTSALPAPAHFFIGGIGLTDPHAALDMAPVVDLSQVAAFDHLLGQPDSTVAKDAAREVDPIETGAIVAGVFHSVAIPIHSFPVSGRWAHVMQDISECAAAASCAGKDQLLARISEASAGKRLIDKVEIVNTMVNNTIRYRADQSLYGKLDYWATPSEILANKSGDCEDFAILKMTALIRIGVPANSLSLVVLRDNGRGVFHAVLAVTTSAGSFILDNVRPKVAMDTDLPNYQPLYSLSGSRAWIHGTKLSNQPVTAEVSDFKAIAPGEGFAILAPEASDLRSTLRPTLAAQ
jgi:predicted transglutaminase-like cysteine proteinase